MKTFRSSSSAETKKFGEKIANQIANSKSRIKHREHAVVVALVGDLGSGKTTFVQGFFRGLGIRKRAVSPTFIIMRRVALLPTTYSLLPFRHVYHIDAYRIKKPKELLKLGLKEIFADPQNIVLIEWADRIKAVLPRNTKVIRFMHSKKESERKMHF